jgi:hypothetical protein
VEYVIGVIVALIGGLLFYRNKAKEAEVDSKLAETKGRDRELKVVHNEINQAIKDIDRGIDKIKQEQKNKNNKQLTPEERAERWNKND